MATKNFLFGQKNKFHPQSTLGYPQIIFLLLTVFVLNSCQTKSKHSATINSATNIKTASPSTINSINTPLPEINSNEDDEIPAPEIIETPTPPSAPNLKIGLILGPGALHAFGHIGVVQEMAKAKLPIHSVVGFEMGALIAAIYTNKGLPYEVEWQMMKLKESDLVQKGLLSQEIKSGDISSLREFMKLALSTASAENAKINFACPAFNMAKQQPFFMNKGAFVDLLPYCISFPPLYKAYQQNVAAVFDYKATADYMRARGANYLVYVDVIGRNPRLTASQTESQILWSFTAREQAKNEKYFDQIVRVPLQDFDLMDYNKRREMLSKGSQAAQSAVATIMKKWGL